jgi:hypothetical protein
LAWVCSNIISIIANRTKLYVTLPSPNLGINNCLSPDVSSLCGPLDRPSGSSGTIHEAHVEDGALAQKTIAAILRFVCIEMSFNAPIAKERLLPKLSELLRMPVVRARVSV